MPSHNTIFSPKDFQKSAVTAMLGKIPDLAEKKKIIQKWQKALASGKITQLTETQLDVLFLNDIFGLVLGYNLGGDTHWDVQIKEATEADGTKPDAVLGYFSTEKSKDVRIIIELKGAKITLDKPQHRKDFKGSPIEQGFAYFPKFSEKCQWLIVSNFEEIRLYHRSLGVMKYESFLLIDLLKEEVLAKFFFLLQKGQLYLLNTLAPIDDLLEQRRNIEQIISAEFYYQYKAHRENIYFALRKRNTDYSNEQLIFVSQKVIDRILFMCFVRDTLQIGDILGKTQNAIDELCFEQEDLLWQAIKATFGSFNKGYQNLRKGRTVIPPFNGGLFAADEILENILLTDDIISPLIDFLLRYDFQSDLNVNILGHIFEQSITDLATFKKEIEEGIIADNEPTTDENEAETLLNKRKKDGIFYTPEHVTEYIIQLALSAYLSEKQADLLAVHGEENAAYWNDYTTVLEKVSILDPACGSGAFLTKVVDILYKEWMIVAKEKAKFLPPKKEEPNVSEGLFEYAIKEDNEEWEIKRKIVSCNIFGVDVNAESVEITKLALWLKTANRKVPLSDLSQNIQHGNSLVSDPDVTHLAFDWNAAFPAIMENGGFDIVLGNPPFVRADLADAQYQKEREWITQHFSYLFEKWDLMTAFYEKGLKLVKKGGYFSFISSNAILTSKYAEKLQAWIASDFEVLSIDYFENVEVFPGVGVVPTIIAIKKQAPTICKVTKHFHIDTFENIHTKIVDTQDIAERIAKIFRKVYEHITITVPTEMLIDICYISKGMVINSDEKDRKIKKFTKDHVLSPIKTKLHPYAIVEGKDLKRYQIERVKYIEWGTDRVPAQLSRSTFPALYKGEKILRGRLTGGVYDDSGILCNDGVIVFKKWIDLKGVSERSISVSISKNHFIEEGSKDSTTIAAMRKQLEDISDKFQVKYLLAILNSEFAYWYLNNFRRHRLENYFYPDDFRALPIAIVSAEIQAELAAKVDIVMAYYKEEPLKIREFWALLYDNFPVFLLEKGIEMGFEEEWKEVLAFLQKHKAKIKPATQIEWKSYYEKAQETYQIATQKLLEADKEIEQKVREIYGKQKI